MSFQPYNVKKQSNIVTPKQSRERRRLSVVPVGERRGALGGIGIGIGIVSESDIDPPPAGRARVKK